MTFINKFGDKNSLVRFTTSLLALPQSFSPNNSHFISRSLRFLQKLITISHVVVIDG